MDFTITVGNLELSFTPSSSSSSSSSTSSKDKSSKKPKITSTGNDLEKIVELTNFSGKIKVIARPQQQQEDKNDFRTTMNRGNVGGIANTSSITSPTTPLAQVSGALSGERKNKGFGLELLRNMKQKGNNNNNNTGDNNNSDTSGGGIRGLERRSSARLSSMTKPDNIEKMTTPLHISCASKNPKIEEMETILLSNPMVVFIPDNEGKLPIHHLSCNQRILENEEQREKVEAFANRLLTAYPESIVIKNNIGHIPFVHSISQWIDTELSKKGEGVLTTPQLINGLHPFFTGMFLCAFLFLYLHMRKVHRTGCRDRITNSGCSNFVFRWPESENRTGDLQSAVPFRGQVYTRA